IAWVVTIHPIRYSPLVIAVAGRLRSRIALHSFRATSLPRTPVTPAQLVPVVLWMTGALLSFSAMAVSIRELSRTLGILEILALRSGLGIIMLGALVLARPELRQAIPTRHI